jgi:hypothetical protein
LLFLADQPTTRRSKLQPEQREVTIDDDNGDGDGGPMLALPGSRCNERKSRRPGAQRSYRTGPSPNQRFNIPP